MSRAAPNHPLDADLLAYVEGVSDDVTSRSISAHLDTCVVCRAKRERLVVAAPADDVHARSPVRPHFVTIDVEDVRSNVVRPGDLWLTDAEDSTMVLVRSVPEVGADVVVVVPVTLDAETSDSTALVLDVSASPLPLPIVVYDELVVSVPASALGRRVIPTNSAVDLLAVSDADPGVRRGSPLEGPADPRLALHQELLDRVVALDTYPTPQEGAVTVEADEDERVPDLRDRLFEARGYACEVREFKTLPVPAPATGWAGVTIVSESTIRIVVIDTPAGLDEVQDFVAARSVLTRTAASALVVCNGFSDRVDLYDPPSLFAAFALPDGDRTSTPLIGSLALADAVIKFLDQKSIAPPPVAEAARRVGRVDAREVLAAKVAEAVEATAARASKLGPDKRAGYANLPAAEDALRDVLSRAFEGDFDPQAVADATDVTDR